MAYLRVELKITGLLEANFELKKSQKVALIGPNGAGKSSLLASFLNLSQLKKTGQIDFKGQNLLDLSTCEIARLGVGIANQQSVVIKNLTLRAVLEAIKPTKKTEIEVLARKLKVEYLLDRDLNHNYSGGEMRRAELLQLMIQDPELVLIDELDSGVDIDSRRIIYDVLRDWLKDKTALIVSHDFEIYNQLKIDKILLIKDQKVIEKPVDYLPQIKQNGYQNEV